MSSLERAALERSISPRAMTLPEKVPFHSESFIMPLRGNRALIIGPGGVCYLVSFTVFSSSLHIVIVYKLD